MIGNTKQTKYSAFLIKKSTSECCVEVIDIVVYRGIVGRFYHTTTSMFMHRDCKMKLRDSKKIMVVSSFPEGYFIRFYYLCSSKCAKTNRFKNQW